jgi:hypothetical protein
MLRVQSVVRALKQHIDGRNYHHDPLMEIAVLAAKSAHTEEWCFNAVFRTPEAAVSHEKHQRVLGR